ncbi:MAG: hypothetical protein VB141_11410 [Burkholderia gladioli]
MRTQPAVNRATQNPASECDKLAAALPGLIAANAKQYKEIRANMEALKRAGLTYAKPHWREQKYLYLVYPCEGGDRKREYVGTDEQKIKAAHAAIARAHEYDSLALQLAQIEKRIAEGRHYLKEAIDALRD